MSFYEKIALGSVSRSVWLAVGFAFAMLPMQTVLAGTQATLYVSPTGSGTSFSLAQPGSLLGVQRYIRTINTNMTGDVMVYLLGGTYQLTNSLQFLENTTNHDSGTDGYNIIYQSYSGQVPVISGGMVVTNWSLYNAATNIWRSFVGTGVNSRQLYVNGVRAIRARGPYNPSGFNWTSTGFTSATAVMASWGNVTNIEIVDNNDWKQLRCPIASITGTNIIMQTPGWTYTGTSPSPGHPWNGNGTVSLSGVTWVENAYELVASPGMWYLNRATGYLYYIPRPGENMTNSTVVLPVVEKLIDASGGALTTPIHNIIFSGVYFEYGTWLLPSTSLGYADNQTSILWSGPTNALKTLGNISFQRASSIQITNCVFEHLGGSAIDFGGGVQNNIVIGNHIEDISSDGISMGEVTDYAATNINQMTATNVLKDNYIRKVGQEYSDAVPIWVGYAKNTLIAHNDIDNATYSGICLGWGWGTYSYAANNQIVSNCVDNVMETLYDGGSCYTLSAQTNSWEIGNYYKNSGLQGIYWDEGTAYYTGISNVVDNCIQDWVHIWTSSITDNTATNNYSNVTSYENNGTDCIITNTIYVTGEAWPTGGQVIIASAGLEPAYTAIKNPEIYVNDTDPSINYVGSGWSYSSGQRLGDYSGDVHDTQTAGGSVQYTFAGTSVTWIGEMNTDESNVAVYIDGVSNATVNCYSTTEISQVRLFNATNLAAGSHTITLTNTGGQYLNLDAFAVVPNPGAPSAPTNLVATGGLGEVTLSWNTVLGATSYNVQRSTTSDGSYTMIGSAATTGYADTSAAGGTTYYYVVSATNASGQSANSAQVSATPMSGSSTEINDTNTAITYTGSDWAYASGRGFGDYDNDVHYAQTAGDSCSYTFIGTGIAYITETYSDEGDVVVYIDGVSNATVSCVSSTRISQQAVYSNLQLSYGTHTIKLVMASGTYMLEDAFIVYNTGAQVINPIEAASYNGESGVGTQPCSEGGLNADGILNGAYLVFSNVDLNNLTSFQARVASDTSGGNIEIYVGGTNGTLIGTCAVPGTGGWQTWTTVTSNLSGASGYQNVYLVFTGGAGYLLNLEWFQFQGPATSIEAASYNSASGVGTQPCSEGGLNAEGILNASYLVFSNVDLNGANSFVARVASDTSGGNIGIYVGGTNGTLIGTCAVPGTDGWQTWTTVTASLNGATGYQNVYLVFTGGSGYLFNVEWFGFTSSGGEQPSVVLPPQLTASPSLSIASRSGGLTLQWPDTGVQSGVDKTSGAGFQPNLYYTPSLVAPVVWMLATNAPVLSNGQWTLTLPVGTNSSGYYRLQ